MRRPSAAPTIVDTGAVTWTYRNELLNIAPSKADAAASPAHFRGEESGRGKVVGTGASRHEQSHEQGRLGSKVPARLGDLRPTSSGR